MDLDAKNPLNDLFEDFEEDRIIIIIFAPFQF